MTMTSVSFFDDPQTEESLLARQIDPSTPAPSGLGLASSMILADRVLASRLSHMPDHLYDLRPDSHLVRFCRAILGDSGVGQLRRRNMVAQFQNSLSSTHFYDLDGFYGAIFGLTRFHRESLSIDPYTDVATESEWQDLAARDAAYRSRIARLSSAINLGATLPGIKAAAEALVETEVDVYETWRLADTYATAGEIAVNTWDDIEAMGTWGDLDGKPWALLSDSFLVGRTGGNLRGEVIVRPRKDYDALSLRLGPQEALRQRAEDAHGLVKVLSVLKPANVLLTVDMEGLSDQVEVIVSEYWSPSNYWEVAAVVTPRPDLVTAENEGLYPLSAGQRESGIQSSQSRVIPKPPWSSQERSSWSYASDVVGVSAYSFSAEGTSEPGHNESIRGSNEEVVVYPNGNDTFQAQRGLMDPQRAQAGRYSAGDVVVAHPYSAPRAKAVLHG